MPLNCLEIIREKNVKELKIIHIDEDMDNASIRDTLLLDKIDTTEDAIMEIYRRLRPSNPPTPETGDKFFKSLFFEPATYDLSNVGRAKMNYKLHMNVPTDITVLRNEDILSAVPKEFLPLSWKEHLAILSRSEKSNPDECPYAPAHARFPEKGTLHPAGLLF